MKKTIETAAALALSSTLVAGLGSTASAASKPSAAAKHKAQAKALAHKFSQELYESSEKFPRGIPVFGLLNGSVETDIKTVSGVHKGHYNNPVILVEPQSDVLTDNNPKRLNHTWIGIPGSNAKGQVVITPVEINLGKHGDTTQSVHVRDKHNTVLEGAAIYATNVSAGKPDELFGFDITGAGSFPSREITADGMK